ncbi:MAG TPA: Smr/MutS family protein [Polyangiaceae bacterium]
MSEERPAPDALDPEGAPSDEDGEPVVVLPIEDSIDLHTFDPREIEDVVDSYLEAAWEKGFQEVRVIHGRGKGVQRARIRAVLSRDPRVQAFGDAPGHRGGWGATLVWLKPRS